MSPLFYTDLYKKHKISIIYHVHISHLSKIKKNNNFTTITGSCSQLSPQVLINLIYDRSNYDWFKNRELKSVSASFY